MNLKLSFSWVGLVVFALPMLINIAYAVFPPVGKAEQGAAVPHWIEIVEQISRITYLAAISLLVSREPIQFQSVWLWLAALFLILYAQLHRAISVLPEIQKRRLILYYFQGLTYEQIAEMEGCTKRAVKFSVDIAVEKLKKFFKNF